ncbi:Ubiquinol-cytochrome c reductase iron-sulfur subunit protein [Salinisphaera shabanensis E1L3A]|uniref:Ubiquinol-cytochrome c reductase iron-sulfur subunit n=1 Tax=Salinisphaera shabanensis E1L3A TaxID=1033802 RepID=U2E7Y5_9GAMM|nr:ubiquinol-cytochrome c reductase iron-sulfur subunit [Salinisphaera shabanensis]ERJ19841.1 Ubiquinol-cytochrome c reductase iron-sulfur subunit protein [Salinisphaera shabanensis E1L3A]
MADFRTTQKDTARRRFLSTALAVTGATGAVAVAVPFMRSWPSARARAAGAPVEVALGAIAPGQQVLVTWRQKPVWVLRRTPDMLQRLRSGELESRLLDPDSQADQQPEYAENPVRSVRPDIFVVVAICTHLGCIPNFRPEVGETPFDPRWPGGYFCPCHGSKFDFAGRVFKGVPAPLNLVVPPYRYTQRDTVIIGENPTI